MGRPTSNGKPEQELGFRYWLAHTARLHRERAGLSTKRVAAALNIDEKTLDRFEKGTTSWPHEVDRILAAYAYLAGLRDERVIYEQAVRAWKRQDEVQPLQPRYASVLAVLLDQIEVDVRDLGKHRHRQTA